MSSWCRNRSFHLAVLAVFTAGGSAEAEQIFFQPRAEVGAEVDSNRDLVTTGNTTTSEGYTGLAGATWGISTPRSDSTLRPELAYSDYPNVHENYLRTTFDGNSQFHSERGQLSLAAQFDRRSTYSSELAPAQFNPVNPNLPTTPETGRISTDTTRSIVTLVPNYTYDLTQRLNWNLTGTYQDMLYTGTYADLYSSYDYYRGGTSLGWAFDPRLDTSLGVFGSRNTAKNDSGSVNSGGVTLDFNYKWSKLFNGRLELTGEHDSTSFLKPIMAKEGTNSAGATFTMLHKGEISTVQLSAGRTFTPSGSGGTFQADQLQAQYNRDFSPRLSLEAAGRAIRYTSLSSIYASSRYDYVNIEAMLRWMVARTWYVKGGAEYYHEKFAGSVGPANNGMLYAGFGYEGLGRQY
jgi:hypothetical protein